MNLPGKSYKRNLLWILGGLTIILSLDGKHYWHDVRFMYAVCNFSFGDIISGEFNPHQVGEKIDNLSSSSGFYYAKLLHLKLLQILFNAVHPSEGGLSAVIWLSIFMMGISLFFIHKFFSRFLNNQDQSFFCTLSLMAMPIVPYLSGKLLTEITAICLTSGAIWAYVVGTRIGMSDYIPSPFVKRFLILSGLLLLLSSLARLDVVLCVIGFIATSILFSRKSHLRKNLFFHGAIVFLISLIGYATIFIFLDLDFKIFINYFADFTGAGQKSMMMSLLGILSFGGFAYLLALVACLHDDRRRVLFFLTWLIISVGPNFLITSTYMIEPRYLTCGMIPLAGLAGLGLQNLHSKLELIPQKLIIPCLLCFIIPLNYFVVRLMPYELDRNAILTAYDKILAIDSQASILLPWSYSDYHFLKTIKPEGRIYNVYSPIEDEKPKDLGEFWQNRLDSWYERNYLSTPHELERLFEKGPVYYLGWRKYPPVTFVENFARSLKLEPMVQLIEKISLMDHLTQSWIWYSRNHRLNFKEGIGQYEIYQVVLLKDLDE